MKSDHPIQINDCTSKTKSDQNDDYDERRNEIESELYKLYYSDYNENNTDTIKSTFARNHFNINNKQRVKIDIKYI